MLWAQLKSKYCFLFWEQVAMRVVLQVFPWGRWFFSPFLFRVPRVQKRIPLSVQFLPIYMRGSNFPSHFSSVMMIFPVIITLGFYGGFPLSSVMLSFRWNGLLDFWLWVDRWCHCSRNILSVMIRVVVVIHSARPSYMSFKSSNV